jgi:hypothetical protein
MDLMNFSNDRFQVGLTAEEKNDQVWSDTIAARVPIGA